MDRIVSFSLSCRLRPAADRSYLAQHRLGQKRPVVSTKFIIKETIEGRMLEVQKRKAELAKLSLSQTISKKDLHERRLEDLKMLFG